MTDRWRDRTRPTNGWRDRVSVPSAVLVALTVAVVVAFVVAASSSSAAFGPYNDDWDGTSRVRAVADATGTEISLVRETTAYSSASPDETVALVLSPDAVYRPKSAARVTDFVRSGGTLVVAADFGPHANELLRSLDADARIDGRPLHDVRSNYRSTAMPVATTVTNHSLVAGVDSVTLNYGSAVEPHGATPLLNSSEYAYLDTDRNGELGENESLGSYPVATVEQVGGGRVVVVADSSAFINAMVDRPGNRRFVRVLLAQHDRLLFDYSHTGALPPLMLALLVVRGSPAAQFGLGALVVAVLAVWSRRPDSLDALRSLGGQSESDPKADVRVSASELAAHLERQHPEWERERVERVVSALERRRNR